MIYTVALDNLKRYYLLNGRILFGMLVDLQKFGASLFRIDLLVSKIFDSYGNTLCASGCGNPTALDDSEVVLGLLMTRRRMTLQMKRIGKMIRRFQLSY